jgi:hypothetical protein
MLRAIAISAVILASGVCRASAVVVSFDDLTVDQDLTNSSFAGLIWEVGTAGYYGQNGFWYASSRTDHPNSLPYSAINAGGCTQIGISFPMIVSVQGAYVAAQGDQIAWTTGVTVHGYRSGQPVSSTSMFTNIGVTPAWFEMNLVDVDRIVFDSVPVFHGGGAFGMDDLTFRYIPEPAALPLLGLLGVCFLRRRRS